MRLERTALELGMELDADEPRVVGPLDDFGQLVVGRHAREEQAGAFECVAVMDVDLVAVAVPLADEVLAVDGANDAIAVELGRIGAQPHGAAEVAVGGALLKPLLAHPLGDHSDHRLRSRAELGRRCLRNARQVPRSFDARHLHAEADAEEWNLALAGELDAGDLALAPALAEPAGNEDSVQRLELSDDIGLGMLEQLGVDPLDVDLRAVGDP